MQGCTTSQNRGIVQYTEDAAMARMSMTERRVMSGRSAPTELLSRRHVHHHFACLHIVEAIVDADDNGVLAGRRSHRIVWLYVLLGVSHGIERLGNGEVVTLRLRVRDFPYRLDRLPATRIDGIFGLIDDRESILCAEGDMDLVPLDLRNQRLDAGWCVVDFEAGAGSIPGQRIFSCVRRGVGGYHSNDIAAVGEQVRIEIDIALGHV